MLSRRRFLHLAGLGGLAVSPFPLLIGCGSSSADAAADGGKPKVEPDPAPPDDPSKAWWLRQDFAPIGESEATNLEIIGALPPALSGLYLRNGPNPQTTDSGHWFVGDGMVHGVELQNGKAPWYKARYIQTEVLGKPSASGPPTLTGHQANTSILRQQGRIFCLEEVGVPYELARADLTTIGPYDFGGKLTTAMTAHPKRDPVTGELLFFGYGVLQPNASFHRVDAAGALVQTEVIPLPKAVMMHDFQITATRVLFMDLPILFDLNLAIAGDAFPFRWTPENGARIGVMPRSGTAADVKWVDIDPCFVFHTWNAFDDETDPNVVHFDGIRYETMWQAGPSDFTTKGAPHRFSINLSTSKATLTKLDDRQVEFPRINPARQGLPYRYGYSVGLSGEGPAGGSLADKIVKYDRQSGAAEEYKLPAGVEADEAMFVPDPAASAEDDGWLLSYVFDHSDNRSRLMVLDATAISAGPVAEVKLPHRVPHGFHGEFFPGTA